MGKNNPDAKPTVILVGADKGGVGKTTITRTLLDYLAMKHVPRRAFDTESPKGALKRFHSDITDIVDVTSAADQMKIFDTINAAEATVIDVRAGLLSATLSALRDIGFLDQPHAGDSAHRRRRGDRRFVGAARRRRRLQAAFGLEQIDHDAIAVDEMALAHARLEHERKAHRRAGGADAAHFAHQPRRR